MLLNLSEISETIAEELLQARDVEKALDGFTRAVQLDPENGEAWNNVACLYVLFALVILLSVHSDIYCFCFLISIYVNIYIHKKGLILSFI